MLSSVTVSTPQGTSLALPIGDVDNGYVIDEINGLDPVKAVLVSSPFANMAGAQFQAARREPRNITLRLRITPDYEVTDVRGLRNALYPVFSPANQISMLFYDSNLPPVRIDGVVESVETKFFDKDPIVDISVMCYNPDFIGTTAITTNGNSVANSAEILVPYSGSVDAGALFQINVNRTITNFTLYNRHPDGIVQTFNFAGNLQNLDVVTINTVPGDKYVRLTRAGVTTSLLYGVTTSSQWATLVPGDNYIRLYISGAAIPFTMVHTPRFGGL